MDDAQSLANTRLDFTFNGRSSHAAAAPHLGRSALDAVELMNVGVNYMREHMPSSARIHYAYLDAGGTAPNVVQGRAKARYAVRAADLPAMLSLVDRVKKVAEGAALMTETSVEVQVISAVSNLLGNTPLEEALQDVMDGLGGVAFDAADRAYAAEIQATLSEGDIAASYRRFGLEPREGEPLCDYVVPRDIRGDGMMGSTDVADVSWAVPTVQARVATHAIGTPGHSWQITAQGKAPAAHKGMTYAGAAMGTLARKLFTDEVLLARARKDHQERLAKQPYICPIPADVKPPLQPKPAGGK